ncbi:MAG: hypothetical protein EOP50_16230 [Sphingobacteriales bacterium]|nr:MAG: hypothetical protein EOP50_16230 [Sphingobacteriales bacterium]
MAVMFLERYSRITYVRDFQVPLGETIKAFFSGFTHVSVVSIIPILEGVIRKIALAQNRDVGNGTRGILREFEGFVAREVASPNSFGERLVMLEALRKFIEDRLLAHTANYTGQNEFNRHGILHGVFGDYGDPLNFFRAVTILDLTCFSIGLLHGGVSAFAPEDTSMSRKLAQFYRVLKKLNEYETEAGI